MDFQVAYWLYLLIFFSGLGIVLRLSVPIAYSWAPILQSLSILIIALVGLKLGPSWLFALVGYSLIVLIYLNSRSFLCRSARQHQCSQRRKAAQTKQKGARYLLGKRW